MYLHVLRVLLAPLVGGPRAALLVVVGAVVRAGEAGVAGQSAVVPHVGRVGGAVSWDNIASHDWSTEDALPDSAQAGQ